MGKNYLIHVYPHGDSEMLAYNLLKVYSAAAKDPNLGIAEYNQRIILKVAYDDYNKAKEIIDSFKIIRWMNTEVVYTQNIPTLGETVNFVELLKDVIHKDPQGFTYIGTTAGVSLRFSDLERDNIKAWAECIYSICLPIGIDDLEYVEHREIYTVGCFKKNTPMDKGGHRTCPWHYSGGQFWLSNSYFYEKGTLEIAECRHGVEMFPGYNIDSKNAFCLYNTELDLYKNKLPIKDWINNAIINL